MRFVVDLLYLLTGAAISPMVLYRIIRYKRYRTGWAQRFGKIRRKNPEKKCIWLHAVSVGEVNAAKTLIEEFQAKFPNFEIVISTITDTGFAQANALFGRNLRVFYFPLDISWIMRRAFKNIRPTICLLMELEVWPNFVQIAKQLNIPVIVINGRISDKSFSRYKKIRPIAKTIFRKVGLVLAQTYEYARRFKELGCPDEKVIITGSLKYDTAQITDKVEGADELAQQLNIPCHCEPEQREGAAISKPADKIASVASLPRNDIIESGKLWVVGGTGDGEEQIILDVYSRLIKKKEFANLRLAIVPRKPERFNEVAQLIKETGFLLIRYSQIKKLAPETTEKSSIVNHQSSIVILGDTMGDLRKFYSLATIIFVGRSLVPMGGSDMMEAAALGKCTIFGPHAFNFQQTVDALLADNGAIMVKDKEELLATMQRCLLEPAYADKIALNGREVIKRNQGATKRTIEQITGFLKG
jgi:3-deoxy-D-manno-octulosonic-acid transferase